MIAPWRGMSPACSLNPRHARSRSPRPCPRGVQAPSRGLPVPESGSELRSAHSTSGMAASPSTLACRLRDALSMMFFTSDRNIMVCTSFTSEYSGSQCMCALATRSSWFPGWGFPAGADQSTHRAGGSAPPKAAGVGVGAVPGMEPRQLCTRHPTPLLLLWAPQWISPGAEGKCPFGTATQKAPQNSLRPAWSHGTVGRAFASYAV